MKRLGIWTAVFLVALVSLLFTMTVQGQEEMESQRVSLTVSQSGNAYNIRWSAPPGLDVVRYELYAEWTGTSAEECGNKQIPCGLGGQIYSGRGTSYRHTGYPAMRARIYVVYAFHRKQVQIENMTVEEEHLHSYDLEHPAPLVGPTATPEGFKRFNNGPPTATPPAGFPEYVPPTPASQSNGECADPQTWPTNVCGCYKPVIRPLPGISNYEFGPPVYTKFFLTEDGTQACG